uniref:Uncharacterized protein n=1 Tax=Cacopsylla melanoneura TaxID=428564 RepID=A0A8D9AXU2_9HEMI
MLLHFTLLTQAFIFHLCFKGFSSFFQRDVCVLISHLGTLKKFRYFRFVVIFCFVCKLLPKKSCFLNKRSGLFLISLHPSYEKLNFKNGYLPTSFFFFFFFYFYFFF